MPAENLVRVSSRLQSWAHSTEPHLETWNSSSNLDNCTAESQFMSCLKAARDSTTDLIASMQNFSPIKVSKEWVLRYASTFNLSDSEAFVCNRFRDGAMLVLNSELNHFKIGAREFCCSSNNSEFESSCTNTQSSSSWSTIFAIIWSLSLFLEKVSYWKM